MNRYEASFDTDWDTLDVEEAALHAYAIGVAAVVGEDNRDHLRRIYEAMQSGYDRSVVELAYEEGRNDARDIGRSKRTWEQLMGEESEEIEGLPEESDLPELIERVELLEGMNMERPGAIDIPEFLRR